MEQFEYRNYKGIGVILVLFILLVIATRVFADPYDPADSDSVLPTATREFTIRNMTSYYMRTRNLNGDFESPPPFLNYIPPNESYSFQLVYQFGSLSSAYALFSFELPLYVASYGTISCFMNVSGSGVQSWHVNQITRPFSERANKGVLEITVGPPSNL
ncbi:hypothetical protein [Paenibacillus herberti]|uniref:Uncharacterized protein n=1 Tax=Paenibacillus herberti TaxID=1619309 RepID=A0A229P157_9BACL|nr:hypothetical protein [Paenibacillus herberti]OXM15932.1 hypothetical protein CGZ75_04275 [Paenibacillus herberti]